MSLPSLAGVDPLDLSPLCGVIRGGGGGMDILSCLSRSRGVKSCDFCAEATGDGSIIGDMSGIEMRLGTGSLICVNSSATSWLVFTAAS